MRFRTVLRPDPAEGDNSPSPYRPPRWISGSRFVIGKGHGRGGKEAKGREGRDLHPEKKNSAPELLPVLCSQTRVYRKLADGIYSNKNSSGDEIANVNFLRRYGT